MQHWVSAGLPPSKLVVGLPTYGRSWSLSSSTNTSLGAPASGAGSAGVLTGEAGFLAYSEICQKLEGGLWTEVVDPSGRMGPYAYGEGEWVGYDDPTMARVKAEYVLAQGLGGAMFWDLPSDDFRNTCGKGAYPIVRAVSDILLS